MTKLHACKSSELPILDHTWQVHIEDLIIKCPVGVYEKEHGRQQKICVNLKLIYTTHRNTYTTYEDVLCYDNLSQRITELCVKEHTELLEQLILKIVDDLIMDVRITKLDIKITKLEAIKNTKSVGVSYQFERT